LAGGEALAYDVLLLATGASAVPPAFPGSDLEGVLTFDTLSDARKVIHHGRKAKSAVVVGGGITAMELAEGLHHHRAHTTLLQRGGRIWPRLFDERESEIIERQIGRQGIDLHHNDEIVAAIGRRGRLAAIRLKGGREIHCQALGVAIGVRPNLGLVRDTGMRLDQGVVVDEYMRSSVPGVFAAGDVAQVYDRWTGQHNLDILWPSAMNEGRTAGYNMVDVAHGREPDSPYVKNSPFNAALLFGIHLTVIGRVGSQARNGDDKASSEELTYLSRGSSQVWTAPFGSHARSAWDKQGQNSLRIVMENGRLVGALILGDQSLADPLRRLIEHEADLTPYQELLLAGNGDLPGNLLRVWRDWHQSWQ
jgi:NAD(P)H-nitrite reductase large subunit